MPFQYSLGSNGIKEAEWLVEGGLHLRNVSTKNTLVITGEKWKLSTNKIILQCLSNAVLEIMV